VLDAARERIARVFDLHARGLITRIVVSVSGGKDSTVLALVVRPARSMTPSVV
jgi:tRNA(Ile)-lysidine synthase TilS/MesJ